MSINPVSQTEPQVPTEQEIAEQKKQEELRAKWFKEGKELEKIPVFERNETMKRIANVKMPYGLNPLLEIDLI